MKETKNNVIQKKGLRKHNNKLIAVTISSLALAAPLVFGNSEADAAETNGNSGEHKTVQSNVNEGNGLLNGGAQGNSNNGKDATQSNDNQGNGVANGGLQGNKNNGENADQSNSHEGNGVLNGGAQGNSNNGKDATQSNDNQGNGVANGDAQGNVNNGGNDDSATANSGEVNKDSKKESNKLPETGESNETTNNTLIGSILVALGTLLFGFRRNRKSE